jgi:hypothetical protein
MTIFILVFVGPAIALISAAYGVFLGLYYLIIPFLVLLMLLRIVFYHCISSKKSNHNDERVKNLIEENRLRMISNANYAKLYQERQL